MIAAGPPAQSEVRSDRPFRRSPVRGVTRGDIGRNLLVSHRVVRLAINRLESAHRCDIDPALQVPAGPPAVDPSARPQGRGDIYELALQRSGGGGVSHHSPAFESRLSLSNCRCCPRPRPGWRTARDALTLPGVAGGDRSGSARGGTRQPLRRYSPRRASRVGPTAITLVARQVWVGVLIGAALRLQPGPARCHLEASSFPPGAHMTVRSRGYARYLVRFLVDRVVAFTEHRRVSVPSSHQRFRRLSPNASNDRHSTGFCRAAKSIREGSSPIASSASR